MGLPVVTFALAVICALCWYFGFRAFVRRAMS
jgi:hypothetical protein